MTTGSAESSSNQHAHVPALPSLIKTEPAEKLRSLLSCKRQECSSLFVSMHNGMWKLRLSGIKSMAPL